MAGSQRPPGLPGASRASRMLPRGLPEAICAAPPGNAAQLRWMDGHGYKGARRQAGRQAGLPGGDRGEHSSRSVRHSPDYLFIVSTLQSFERVASQSLSARGNHILRCVCPGFAPGTFSLAFPLLVSAGGVDHFGLRTSHWGTTGLAWQAGEQTNSGFTRRLSVRVPTCRAFQKASKVASCLLPPVTGVAELRLIQVLAL